MPYTAQDLVAQARAVIEEIDSERLRALQADNVPVIDVREAEEFFSEGQKGSSAPPKSSWSLWAGCRTCTGRRCCVITGRTSR